MFKYMNMKILKCATTEDCYHKSGDLERTFLLEGRHGRPELRRGNKEAYREMEGTISIIKEDYNLGYREETIPRGGREKDYGLLAADLFCGAGGSSLGLITAGFRPVLAVDIDPTSLETYCHNLSPYTKAVVEGDLSALRGEELLDRAGLLPGELDLIIGCPPCQGFTDHGRPGDPRNVLVSAFLKRIEEMRPRAVLFENVTGILERGHLLFEQFRRGLQSLGYSTICQVVGAVHYGVPQRRRRVVLAAVLRELGRPHLPRPTHNHPRLARKKGLQPWKTVREAISDLPPLNSGERCPYIPNHEAPRHSSRILELIKRIPPDGGSIRNLPRRFWLRCHLRHDGHKDVYGRMRWDAPAPTITTGVYSPSKGRFIHPEQHRGITMREAARLQGFPDWFRFLGGRTIQARHIGNALPPPLAAALAAALLPVFAENGHISWDYIQMIEASTVTAVIC
jgi:DNA (cytosine-5)-methyltransferase 1